MRAIVTDEQRRSRPEAGLPSIEFASLELGDPLRKGRALLRGERRRSSVTYSRYPLRGRGLSGPSQTPATGRRDPSSLLVAPQNRPANC